MDIPNAGPPLPTTSQFCDANHVANAGEQRPAPAARQKTMVEDLVASGLGEPVLAMRARLTSSLEASSPNPMRTTESLLSLATLQACCW